MHELFILALVAAPASIVLVECVLRLPVIPTLWGLPTTISKAMKVMTSSKVSDHWKELVLRSYAFAILRLSLALLLMFLIGLIAFAVTLQAVGMAIHGSFDARAAILRIDVAIVATIIAVIYFLARRAIANG